MGPQHAGQDDSRTAVPGNHGNVSHAMVKTEHLSGAGGISLKIRDVPAYNVKPAGIVQVEYFLSEKNNTLWYDLSLINCDRRVGSDHPLYCPLIAGGLKMHVPGASAAECRTASCARGRCENVYEHAGVWLGEPTLRCNAGVDVVVETCTESVGPKTFQHESTASPPAEKIKPGDVKTSLQVSSNGSCGGATGFTWYSILDRNVCWKTC